MGRKPLDHHPMVVGIERASLARLDALLAEKGRAEFIRKTVNQMLDQVETAQRIAERAIRRAK